MREEKTKIEGKEERTLHCPFHKGLACEDCRLFQQFSGSIEKQCVFIFAAMRSL